MDEEDHNITLDIFQSVRILINRLSCRSESSNLSLVVYVCLSFSMSVEEREGKVTKVNQR